MIQLNHFSFDQNSILEVCKRIKPYIHQTPILTSQSLDKMFGANLFFKCENFQKTGAFKMRGAANAVFSLSDSDIKNGVCTHSSGNHAQALAWAARLRNVPAYIVMPNNSPAVKKQAVLGYGATVIESENTLQDRERNLAEVMQKTKAFFVPPYNDYAVIAGQASCAKEIIDETPDLDIIISPVGGGGLLSGTAISTHLFSPKTKVFAAEPILADDAFESFYSGILQTQRPPKTIADGLRTSLGEKNFEIIQKYVSEIRLATEEQIVQAMKLIWERLKIVIEPSCALPLAIILANPQDFAGKRIAMILTGGNVDLSSFFENLLSQK
ncbi:MAG: pyridoxal-phosphate dependent enzyme [Bacteroidetes bacterium]|nr:MAG: pyridoxal-phosphate dependent enzyme [Bacteroidota bacterium]